MKRCTKCRDWKSFSEFHKDKRAKSGLVCHCKGCVRKYQQAHKVRKAKHNKEYQQTHRTKFLKYNKKRRKTIIGCLRVRFYNIKDRCNNSKCVVYKNYGGRGIKCLFGSADEFVNYVLNKLKIDPRGLQIDRIDNNGHYEPGNIQFLTIKKHRQKHLE